MPQAIPIIALAVTATGVGLEVASMVNKPKTPETSTPAATALPATPTTETAAESAQTLLTQQRRTLLASGGQTSLTGIGGAPLLSGDVASKSLLGG